MVKNRLALDARLRSSIEAKVRTAMQSVVSIERQTPSGVALGGISYDAGTDEIVRVLRLLDKKPTDC